MRREQSFPDYVKDRIAEHPEWEESYNDMLKFVQRQQKEEDETHGNT